MEILSIVNELLNRKNNVKNLIQLLGSEKGLHVNNIKIKVVPGTPQPIMDLPIEPTPPIQPTHDEMVKDEQTVYWNEMDKYDKEMEQYNKEMEYYYVLMTPTMTLEYEIEIFDGNIKIAIVHAPISWASKFMLDKAIVTYEPSGLSKQY